MTAAQFRTFIAVQPFVIVSVFGLGYGLAKLDAHLRQRFQEAATLEQLARAARNQRLYLISMVVAILLFFGADFLLISPWSLAIWIPVAAWTLYWALPRVRTLRGSTTLHVNATPHQLWSLLSDKTQLPNWCPGYVAATRDALDPNLYHVTVELPGGRRLEGWERVQVTVEDREILSATRTIQTRMTFTPVADGAIFEVEMIQHHSYYRMLLGEYWTLKRRYLPGALERQRTWMQAAVEYIQHGGRRTAVGEVTEAAASPWVARERPVTATRPADDGTRLIAIATASTLTGALLAGFLTGHFMAGSIQLRVLVGALVAAGAAAVETGLWTVIVRRRRRAVSHP